MTEQTTHEYDNHTKKEIYEELQAQRIQGAIKQAFIEELREAQQQRALRDVQNYSVRRVNDARATNEFTNGFLLANIFLSISLLALLVVTLAL